MQKLAAVLVASALAGTSFLLADPVGAAALSSGVSPVVCGATLTTNTTLTHDLHCPTGTGLILDGNITLNLGGHGIYGATPFYPGYDAIETGAGDTVHVTNGRIQGWGFGIAPHDSDKNTTDVSHVTFVHDYAGLTLTDTKFNITDSTFEYDALGVYVYPENPGVPEPGTVTHSTFYQVGNAIYDVSGGGVNASYDTFVGAANQPPAGAEVTYNVNGTTTISHSTFTNVQEAVFVDGYRYKATTNLIDDTISGADVGFQLDYANGTLIGNTFTHNQTSVLVMWPSSAVTAINNLFEYSGPLEFQVLTQYGSTLTSDNLLVGNTFYKNRGDGLDIMMPGASLKSNRAIDNTGHGMVVVGVTNLGGNIAYGNTKNPQCIGLVCHP